MGPIGLMSNPPFVPSEEALSPPALRYFMGPCFDARAMRDLDRRSAAAQGITELDLMQRAGAAAVSHLLKQWPMATRFAVVCGTGNNGGDGWVVATLLRERGLSCDVFLLGQSEKISGAARLAYDAWCGLAPGEVRSSDEWPERAPSGGRYDLIIDALVGIGFKGSRRARFEGLVESINAAAAPILSLDVPSGLNADTGAALSAVVEATSTITFIAMKPGLVTGRGRDVTGHLLLDPLGTPQSAVAETPPVAQSWATTLPPPLPRRRPPTAHKGAFGHVLVVGGNVGMGGASILTAAAALRAGAGLVTLATQPTHLSAAISRHPELMTCDIERPERLSPLLQRASVVVIGPGLGDDSWSVACLRLALDSKKPLVLDADALNLLAGDGGLPDITEGSVLTPHPGEAARLAKVRIVDIETDRIHWARRLARQYRGTVILKGAGSIVASDDESGRVDICSAGNPGMATGGMGDVLAGLVGALLGQGNEAHIAALGGTIAHAAAGDLAWRVNGIGLTASDVISHLGAVLTPEVGADAPR